MSEVGGEVIKPQSIEQKSPQKEQGNKSAENAVAPEKKMPLSKKLGAAIKYVSASVSERKSQEADNELTYISQEGVEPKTLKEHLEKEREPKEFRFQLSGSKIPVEMMRAKELPEEMVLNVVLTGGAQGGIGNAEAVIKMMEMGLFDKKNLKINFWGISAGAGNAAYAATGAEKAKEAVKMYTEENLGYTVDKDGKKTDTGGKLVHLPDGKAAQFKALLESNPGKPLVDTGYVADNVASGKRKLDVKALRDSNYGVFVRLMNEDGGQEWVDLKQEEDPANTLRAAINVPGVARESFIKRNGKNYADGAFAEGPLLEEIFNKQGPDAKVLIISNGSFGKGGQMEIVQKILARKAREKGENAYGYNDKVAELIEKHNEISKTQGKQVWDEIVAGKNIALMELTRDSDFVPELEKDPGKLKKAGEKFAEFTGNVFDLGKELPLKPQGLMSAGEELRAMDTFGKSVAETKPVGVVKSEAGNEQLVKEEGAKVAERRTGGLTDNKSEINGKDTGKSLVEEDKVEERLQGELWKYINNGQLMEVMKGVGKLEGRGTDFIYHEHEYNVKVLEKVLDLVKKRGIKTFVESEYKQQNPLTRGEKIWKFATRELPIFTTVIFGLENPALAAMSAMGLSKDPVVYALLKDYKKELTQAKKMKVGQGEPQNKLQEKKAT